MLSELKKLSSFKVLIYLLIIAVSIYLLEIASAYLSFFSDILLIFVFAWILSFILEPPVELIEKVFRIPKIISTLLVFTLIGVSIVLVVALFLPAIVYQFHALSGLLPEIVSKTPPIFKKGISDFVSSISSISDYTSIIPPIAQFQLTPKSWHKNINFVQKVIDQTFASFLRVQLLYGVIGGITTWLVLTAFQIKLAISTSIIAGVLTAVPVIGPIIGVFPPAIVAFIENPPSALLIIAILLIVQQVIFNVLGAKIISKAFKINPVIVVVVLLIGFKVAGVIGGLFAVPLVSIAIVVGHEFHNYYLEDKEN
ncbi:MAG: hypothetical protein US07_C0013G0018 [Candidatus Levybacteria bacterium GW2011_GWB1_36_18]|nr:MAG: hypothetical protein US07_C0013G0018 [Candidatus Levybacteria bacterium GW2011_GWB1_36_18]